MDPWKKSKMTWLTQLFLGVSVLVLIGAVVFGIMVSRDGGAAFHNLISGDSGNLLSIEK